MAKWKIELKDVGPERACETAVVEAENLVKAKVHAMRACRRHLPGGDIYLEAEGHYRYLVICSLDEVGEVQLTCLDAHPRGTPSPRQVQESESLT